MQIPDKSQGSRMMTLLVQLASWASGATAVAVLAVAMWPKGAELVLPSLEPPSIQGVQQEMITLAEPEVQILDLPAQKPLLKIEMPLRKEPIAY